MKIAAFVLIYLLISQVSVLAQERTEAEAARHFAEQTGSRLAHLKAQMLYRKHKLEWKASDSELSDYGLKNNIFGGSPVLANSYSRVVRLVTGGRAIDETLQLDTITAQISKPEDRTIPIEDVEPLKIRSHPWAEMISELPRREKASTIFELVPHDHFVVYFESGADLKALEMTLDELSPPVAQVLPLSIPPRLGLKALQRLGISEVPNGEVVFLSEDLDFYPATHYAVILSQEIPETGASGKVGKYWVASTSPRLFQRIKTVASGEAPSMGKSLDFQYANSVIDQPRDGLVYLSEAFILKLVSPEHRLNSARRLAAIDAMAAGQELVWAYRSVSGRWPQVLEQIHREGFISDVKTDLVIGKDGLVRDGLWGDLYHLKSLSDVPLQAVSEEEQEAYKNFREGYQRYWREFFDPVGIGIRVGEELSLHTIILPLIDSSEYNELVELAAGQVISFDSLETTLGNAPVSLHTRVNYDDLILKAVMGRSTQDNDEETKAAQEAQVNAEVSKNVARGKPVDVFSFFGNEAFFCLLEPKGNTLDPANLSCLAVEMDDIEAFRRVVRFNDFELETRTFGEQIYYQVPFIFGSHIYATYVDNFLCLTPKELPMKLLCAAVVESSKTSVSGFRGQEELGSKHHVLFRSDFTGSDWFGQFLTDWVSKERLADEFRYHTGYLGDRQVLELALDGTSQKVDDLLRPVPAELYGVPFNTVGEKMTFGGVPLEQVYRNRWGQSSEGKLSVASILDELDAWEMVRHSGDNLQWLTATLDFTPEGLSTHLVLKVGEKQTNWFGKN